MSIGAAKGTVLKVNSKAVARLKSIGGISTSADQIDVTTLDNEDGYKEYIVGFKDGGEVPVSGFFDFEDEGQREVAELFESGDTADCEIVFPKKIGAKWGFKAVVTAFETSVEVEDAVGFSATLKVSGKPTLAASTAGA